MSDDKPKESAYSAQDFAMMLAFELGYKACEKGKNFQQAFEDFKSDIFRDEPRKEQPLTCPDCGGEADERVLAGMKCGRCAYGGQP